MIERYRHTQRATHHDNQRAYSRPRILREGYLDRFRHFSNLVSIMIRTRGYMLSSRLTISHWMWTIRSHTSTISQGWATSNLSRAACRTRESSRAAEIILSPPQSCEKKLSQKNGNFNGRISEIIPIALIPLNINELHCIHCLPFTRFSICGSKLVVEIRMIFSKLRFVSLRRFGSSASRERRNTVLVELRLKPKNFLFRDVNDDHRCCWRIRCDSDREPP